jgi:hypothetical protein
MGSGEKGTDPGPAEAGQASGLPRPIYNWLSIVGCALAACGPTALVFFALVGVVIGDASGYAALAFLPPIAVTGLGLVLIVVGWVRERWRQKHGRHSSFHERWVVDPSRYVRHTGPLVILAGLVFGTFLLLGAGAGSVALVGYTESNEFCGEMCHAVMSPEATVHASSAHGRIACVECHVGHGGDSYIRAKLNGLRQVYSIVTGGIQRPIPTPIHNRRLSNEMCETCHRAERFIDYKAITRPYFLSGEDVEAVKLRMLVKVGGGADGLMEGSGIHYHMMLEHKVEYIARDPQRQEIAWVRIHHPDGSVAEFSNELDPLSDQERETLEVRVMECLDCHSRPAHRFPSPVDSVNTALAAGALPAEIPYIKEASVRALDGGYETTGQAMAGIASSLRSFYRENAPEVLEGDSGKLDASIDLLRKIYRSTIFPEMKADWSAHPDNIGHRDWPGCFRCHNDEMVDEEGEPVFTDCTRCHAILAQGGESVELAADFEEGLDFVHPEDEDTFDEFTLCTDCHTGGADLYE